jgi:hypothetical protein
MIWRVQAVTPVGDPGDLDEKEVGEAADVAEVLRRVAPYFDEYDGEVTLRVLHADAEGEGGGG